MARKDALLRLHKRLIAKRDALRRKLVEEQDLPESAAGASDVADAATDGAHNELNSQLAAMESRELDQVERAIDLMREGRYGYCEVCERPIPIERLKALPFTPFCVECQRKVEESGGSYGEMDADWETAFEFEGRMSEKDVTIRDLDLDT